MRESPQAHCALHASLGGAMGALPCTSTLTGHATGGPSTELILRRSLRREWAGGGCVSSAHRALLLSRLDRCLHLDHCYRLDHCLRLDRCCRLDHCRRLDHCPRPHRCLGLYAERGTSCCLLLLLCVASWIYLSG